MCRFKRILWLGMLALLMIGCRGQSFDFSLQHMLISSNGDETSADIADYFYDHLSRRIMEGGKVDFLRSDQALSYDGNTIYFEIVQDLADDYEIINERHRLSIFAKNKETMQWLAYSLIDRLARDQKEIDVSDLPPTFIDFTDARGNIQMKYRDPHLSPNLSPDYPGVHATHSIDHDWGLWGHNMKTVFTEGIDNTALAWIDGRRNEDQFCFSAESSFEAVKEFVMDEYGDGEQESKWFMLAPNDNDLVCGCATCSKLGNTDRYATPAVNHLLNRIAEQYPKHFFFTIAYRTTEDVPPSPMLDNTGVFISTAQLPKTIGLDLERNDVKMFGNLLDKWKSKTKHIYLWDYISNFDDYLTPYPVLLRVQSQLPFFIDRGVNGVFLNGSGYDFSPFDDVKTYVLGALLIDPSLSVRTLVEKYFQRFYPNAGGLLASYYLKLEEASVSDGLPASMYFPFREGTNSYFSDVRFIEFYHELEKKALLLQGNEKANVDKLLTAMSYPYLQCLYQGGTSKDGFLETTNKGLRVSDRVVEPLQRLRLSTEYPDMISYKEEDGRLRDYVNEWEKLLDEKELKPNLLSDIQVSSIGGKEPVADAHILSDQVLGFPSDFNQGWLLSAVDLNIESRIVAQQPEQKKLTIRFLINSKHRMLPPDRVEIYKNGISEGVFSEENLVFENVNLARLELPVIIEGETDLVIKVIKSKEIEKSVIACDEIQLY